MNVRAKDVALVVGVLAFATSVGMNIRLYRERSRPAAARGPDPGTTVRPFSARNVANGVLETVRLDPTRPTALYVFTSSCPWCQRNAANIRALAEQRQDKYRFVGLLLSDEGQMEGPPFPFPVYGGMGPETREAYRLGAIPQMILVGPDGRVLKTWTGAFAGPVAREIEGYFDVRLPGVRDAAHAPAS
jgi:hypothetical protein